MLARLDRERLAVLAAQAEANFRKLESNYNRNQELYNRKLISAEEFQSAKFEFESQRAAFDLAKLDLDYTSIRAPITGVIAERYIKVGNMVLNNAVTFKITGFDPLRAVLYILFMIGIVVVFGKLWVELGGLSPKSAAKNPRYFVETIGISIFIPCVKTSTESTPAVSNNPKILGN